ncbi:histone deacetylase [Desulfopila sp. IMCC35008]|uniref:histone deacetylase family protein n=1 Tax=Desulfopila sp. IMCC35008 TaxID=2653858 RepID=UPI001F113001|nr:histone deacetylase [Desulfopila sp. IMCC35008]
MTQYMPTAPNRTGLVLFPAFDWCISPSHPEREERLLYTKDQLIEEGLEDVGNIVFFNPELAEYHDIDRVHLCVPSSQKLLTESHLISAGGAIRAARAVLEKEVDKSFAVVRPPGHHAMQTVFGDRGFCIVNIEAVMVEYIRRHYGIRKIAIIDSDCHHGDGTQDIFYNDPDTLFISIHQDGRTLYPGSGFIQESGGPSAPGYTINLPLPPGTSEEGFDMVMERVVMPIIDDFQPELIINSAGQDNHYTDPITNMNFTAQGYARLNRMLNPDISVLEGGYSIEGALPYTNLGIILAMAGLDTSNVKEPDYDPKNFLQSRDMNDHIENVCFQALDLYHNREHLRREMADKPVRASQRSIFYDTTGFVVEEARIYHGCPECPGYAELTAKGLNNRVRAFTVPFNSCPKCHTKAKDEFQASEKSLRWTTVLQDRIEDVYEVK